jgi:hypothetical protein
MEHKRAVASVGDVPHPGGKADMNAWWWVLIGLVAWFGVSLAVGLFLGPVLRRTSRAQEALDADTGETPAGREKPPQNGQSPRDGPRAA